MKTFNKTHLPDEINYKGEIYTLNIELTTLYLKTKTPEEDMKEILKTQNKKAIQVLVLSKNLKGKTDFFRNPYKPFKYFFTN